jgi:hypothetical protein
MFLRFLTFILFFILASFTLAQDAASTKPPEPSNSVISGRAYYEDTGRPVRRAMINLMAERYRGLDRSVLTDGDGNYQITDVRAGSYYLVVDAPGVISPGSYSTGKAATDNNLSEFTRIVVNGINNIEANVPAKRGGAISGKVAYSDGDPAIGVRIDVLRKTENAFIPVVPNLSSILLPTNGGAGVYQTDDRGYFRSAGLPEGKYIVRITEKGSHTQSIKFYLQDQIFGGDSLLSMYYPDASDISLAKLVEIKLGEESPEITIVIPDRDVYKISGRLVALKGQIPFRGADLKLRRKPDPANRVVDEGSRFEVIVRTDDDGNWAFEQLPKGNYEIVVEAFAFSYNRGARIYSSNTGGNNDPRYDLKNEAKFARKVHEIKLEKDLKDFVIEMEAEAVVSGAVMIEGEGFPKSIRLNWAAVNGEFLGSDTLWGPVKGRNVINDFSLRALPAGKGFLRISIDDDGFYVKSAKLGTSDLLLEPLELKAGQIVRRVQVVLGTDVGTVKGRVTDERNRASAHTNLLFVPKVESKDRWDKDLRWVTTTETGDFELRLAPGEYLVLFADGVKDRQGDEFRNSVTELAERAVKIKVEPRGIQKLVLRRATEK